LLVHWQEIKGVETNRVLQFVSKHVDLARSGAIFSRATRAEDIDSYGDRSLSQVVHLWRCNNVSKLNTFFFRLNDKMADGGRFICRTETLELRKQRHIHKYGILQPLHYPLDFLLKRVFPKLSATRGMYFSLTGGKNRAMSKTEVLGRLVYAGFEVEHIEEIDGLLYIVSKKVARPSTAPKPSHGMLLQIQRLGADGKKIKVYKFRTMHPYAQYVQDFIYKNNALADGGKFKDDFRITKWGRWMRRFWVDELPMLWNILRGDLKMVGVRPISEHYMSLYTEEHQAKRKRSKPGFIPPFYADMPVTLADIMESESRYIDTYNAEGWRADLSYVVRGVNNVFVNGARST